MKRVSILLALAGLAGATALIGYYGFGHVAAALVKVGWGGFAALLAWQLALAALLGLSWYAVMPPGSGGVALMIWGRLVRESAATCLPFSQVGGFVLGARALTLRGIGWPLASASTIVDVTNEFVAQVIFALLGLALLARQLPDRHLAGPASAAVLIAGGMAVLLIWFQRRGLVPLFGALGRRIAGRELGSRAAESLRAELDGMFGRTGAIALGSGLHLLSWIGTGIGTWLACRFLGAPITFASALAIEGLLHGALAAAFVVPGLLGVQEAAYVALGGLFGLPPDIGLSLSLIKRARDLAFGVPVLLIWQWLEVRALRA